MARRNIGHGWTIELPDEFADREEDGNQHVFWQGGRTVYAAVYPVAGGEAEAALAEMAAERGVRPAERLERRDGPSSGEAWLMPEESDDGRAYWGLNTFTSSPAGSVACVTFYFPDRADAAWATAAWHTVRPPATTSGGAN